MLVNEAGRVVDLVMDDKVQVLLSCVLGDVRVSELLLCRHCCVLNLCELGRER